MKVDFERVDLVKVDFERVDLVKVDFERVDLVRLNQSRRGLGTQDEIRFDQEFYSFDKKCKTLIA